MLRIEKLRADYATAGFDCGFAEPNRFLVRFTLTKQQAGAAQTYNALSDPTIVGYSSLAVGEGAYYGAPERLSKGLSLHPTLIPPGSEEATQTGPWPSLRAAGRPGGCRRPL